MRNEYFFVNGDEEMVLDSSTPGSDKRFKVTCDDSGALTVTNVQTGETKPVGGSSGGGAFDVYVSPAEDGSFMIDKTWVDIVNAHRAGQVVRVIANGIVLNMSYAPVANSEPPTAGNGEGAMFFGFILDDGGMKLYELTVDANSVVTVRFASTPVTIE